MRYVIFRHDFAANRWHMEAHVDAEDGMRAIKTHALTDKVPALGTYVAVPDDELHDFLSKRTEVRIGLDVGISEPKRVDQ